jgi:chloramphenicol 3-O phosphotransferase
VSGAGVRVVVLNGGSSAGTTSVGRCLQTVLPGHWLLLGIDGFVDALPPHLRDGSGGDGFGCSADGEVAVGAAFRELEAAWMRGVAATARAGARVVVDDVFLGGAASQRRWADALDGLPVLWAGVHCDPDVAAAREAARGDRVAGMARHQARQVHRGVRYDVTVDTTRTAALDCARRIAAHPAGDPG